MHSKAQIGVGTTSPKPSAVLDVTSTNKGLLIPRVALAGNNDTTTIPSPETSLLIYNTSDISGINSISAGFCFFNGTNWTPISANNTAEWTDTDSSIFASDAALNGDTIVITENGQIGIGTTVPNTYSSLDIESSNTGVLIPRVNLTSSTLDLNTDNDNDISNQPISLMVYNSGTTLTQGYYYWNGTQWRFMDNSPSLPAELSEINCTSSTMLPDIYGTSSISDYVLTVPYSGGNGGRYGTLTIPASVTTNNLQAVLQPGKLEYGYGALTFIVSGTPTSASPATATFTITKTLLQSAGINFPTTSSFTSCNVVVGQSSSNADVRTTAVLGPLKFKSAADGGGRDGYEQVITSSDGKFSVRCYIHSGNNFQNVNLQIRNNSPSVVEIISNEAYVWAGVGGTRNNKLQLPANVWCGANTNTSTSPVLATEQLPGNFVSWSDAGVYASGMPEYRMYEWTKSDPTDKTFYELRFMMGSQTPTSTANTVSCPSNICNTTKVYFYLREIKAQ